MFVVRKCFLPSPCVLYYYTVIFGNHVLISILRACQNVYALVSMHLMYIDGFCSGEYIQSLSDALFLLPLDY